MEKLALAFAFFALLLPSGAVWSEEKDLIAKGKKSVKYKKKKYKKRERIKYPFKANVKVSAEKIKMKDLLKDIYE